MRRSLLCPAHFPILPGASETRLICSVPDDRSVSDGLMLSENFHAAWGKNQFLSAGLAQIRPESAILCDGDVVLSNELLDRINSAMQVCPSSGKLYGLVGRRVCRILRSFALADLGLQRNATVIGYCQFTRENDVESWNTGREHWGGGHDDWKVSEASGPGRSVALPFACYHLGGVSRHWGGFQGRLPAAGELEACRSDLGEMSALFDKELEFRQILLL